MKMKSLTGKDFLFDRSPGPGERVLYYAIDQKGRKYARAGIIAREQDLRTWVVHGMPVYKECILFVLTSDAYNTFRALLNPLAF